jgi:hypothetical protein
MEVKNAKVLQKRGFLVEDPLRVVVVRVVVVRVVVNNVIIRIVGV